METRKIQKTGGSTYIISLPKQWMVENNLKNGNVVAMEVDENSLRIWNPNVELSEKKASLSIERNRTMFERLFISAYIKGLDSIEIRSKTIMSAETKDFIRNFSREFIGMEIVNEKTGVVEINSILGPKGLSINSGIRRMCLITRSMFEDVIHVLEQKNKRICDEIIGRDYDINRLSMFVARRCHEILEGKVNEQVKKGETSDFLLFSRTLERIADHAKNIAGNIKETESIDKKIERNIIKNGNDLLKLFDDTITSFFKHNENLANTSIDLARKMALEIYEISEGESTQTVPIAYIIESLSRCASYISDLGEIAINHIMGDVKERNIR